MFASGRPNAAGTKAGMPSPPNAPAGRNKRNPMRDAERALGERSEYRSRLKGATARSARRLAARRSRRGSCAFQARVLFVCPSPKRLPPHGVILVPHFMRIPRGNAWGRRRPRLRCGARERLARGQKVFCRGRRGWTQMKAPSGLPQKKPRAEARGMRTKRKSLVKATLFPRRTDAPGAGSPRRGLSDFPPCPRFPPGVSKRDAPDGGFSKRERIFKSPEGAKLLSVGQANLFAQPYEIHTEKCALQERD